MHDSTDDGPHAVLANYPPIEPGDPLPWAAGYVRTECGHSMAASEWRAGFRRCERCPPLKGATLPPGPARDPERHRPVEDDNAAVAGRVFVKTCGIAADPAETRFRMRRARVGDRVIEIYRDGRPFATVTELDQHGEARPGCGWLVEWIDGRNSEVSGPTFGEALALVDAVAPVDVLNPRLAEVHRDFVDTLARATQWNQTLRLGDERPNWEALPGMVEATHELAIVTAELWAILKRLPAGGGS